MTTMTTKYLDDFKSTPDTFNKHADNRPIRFSPHELVGEFLRWLEWCEENPIVIESNAKDGSVVCHNKPRPLTFKSFYAFTGISDTLFRNYEKRLEYADVIENMRNIVSDQKFSLAAVGIFKESLIAKEMGMVEKSQVESTFNVTVFDNFDESDLETNND